MNANFFNPFLGLIETKNTPHARTLRSSLRTKFSDVFYAFHGHLDNSDSQNIGLFDYATLFIPALAQAFLQWCLNHKADNKFMPFLTILASAINIPMYIARLGVAAIATLITAPITLLVQGVVSLVRGSLREDALAIEGKTGEDSYVTLQNLLEEKDIDLENVRATLCEVKINDHVEHHIALSQKVKLEDGKIQYNPIENFDITITKAQKPAASYFFKLNIGQIVTAVETVRPQEADTLYQQYTTLS